MRLRPLLILVDGSLDVAQLLIKCRPLGLSMEHLQTLVDSGMCEVSAAAPPPAAMAAPRAVQAMAVAAPRRPVKRSVALARMHLLDLMERFLGAESELVRATIRSAQTRDEVLQVLTLCLEVVREIGGEERVGVVRERVLELLPEAPQPEAATAVAAGS